MRIILILSTITVFFILIVYLPSIIALPLFIIPFKFVIYITSMGPLIITIIFLLLMWIEDFFPGQLVNYTLLRRRIGDTKGPWEDFYIFQNISDKDDHDLFTDFTNLFYSSDGFFPHTFNERDPFPESSLMDRFITQKDIIHYNKHTVYHYPLEIKYPTGEYKDPPIPTNIEPPVELKKPYTIFPLDDFATLGATMSSLSHFDASSYIHELETPTLFLGRTLPNLRRLRKFKGLSIWLFDEALFWPKKPSYPGYGSKLKFQAEYPSNVDFVHLVRQWQDNPSSIVWQDPFSNLYSNLTRFNGLVYTFDWLTDALVFAPPSAAPKGVSRYRASIKRFDLELKMHTISEITKKNTVASHSVIVPDFMRFGLLRPYLSKLLLFLIPSFLVDTFRFKYLYNENASGDLESLPFMARIFTFMRLFAFIAILFKQTPCNKAQALFKTKSPDILRNIINKRKSALDLSRHKIKTFLARPLTTNIKRDIRDIYSTEQTYLRWYRRNFRHDVIREETLIRTSKFSREAKSIGKWSVLGHFRFFRDKIIEFDEKFTGDSALLPLEYTYDEDRYSSDYEYLSNLHQYTQPHFDIDLDNFRSFHLAEYEYLVEEEDFFDQSMGEDLSGLVMLFLLVYIDLPAVDIALVLWYVVIPFLVTTFVGLLAIDTANEDVEFIDYDAGYLTHDISSFEEYEQFDDVLAPRITKEGVFMLEDFTPDDILFHNTGIELDVMGTDLDELGEEEFLAYTEFEDINPDHYMRWAVPGFIRNFFYRRFPWMWLPDFLDDEEQPERVSSEDPANTNGVYLNEGDETGYYENATLSGDTQEDDGDELLLDDPFVLDTQDYQPEESPVLNIYLTTIFLELEYEGGVVADDHDEAEEDIEEIEGDPALDQLSYSFNDEEPDDEDDDEPEDVELFEDLFYDEEVDELHDYEYDDEMVDDEFDAEYFHPDLESIPNLPLGHLTYKEACLDFYLKLFSFMQTHKGSLYEKIRFVLYLLYRI
jgi:hypothetical protein